MKNLYLTSLLLLLGTCWSANIQASELSLLSQNMHCNPNSDEEQLKEKIHKLISLSRDFSPDVIALQEVCSHENQDFLGDLKRSLKNTYPYVKSLFTHRAWDKFNEELVVFSKYPLQNVLLEYLPTSPLQRGMVGIKVQGIWIFNTHLSHIGADEGLKIRKAQVEFIRQKVEDKKAIIVGDFNSSPNDPEMEPFWKNKFTPFFPAPTYPSPVPRYFIDGIWLCNLPAFVYPIAVDAVPSDHLGVFFKILF